MQIWRKRIPVGSQNSKPFDVFFVVGADSNAEAREAVQSLYPSAWDIECKPNSIEASGFGFELVAELYFLPLGGAVLF